ncbi:MAG TPA: hypothetical protein PK718_06010 [Candidatus Methanofastidiosa archaeon]|nr:hypothetical protein [Candidatus Methanofastidiosa archaeon]
MSKKRSKISKKVTFSESEAPLPKENEMVGVIERLLGGDRLLVLVDDEEHIVRIPGRYKGQVLLRRGSYVLLGQVIEGSYDNMEILYKYSPDDLDRLIEMGIVEGE